MAREVTGAGGNVGGYRVLNDTAIRDGIVAAAATRYGYRPDQVHMRLYVGKWASTRGVDNRQATIDWCGGICAGAGPIEVVDLDTVVADVRKAASSNTYLDDPIIVTLKVLSAAGVLP